MKEARADFLLEIGCEEIPAWMIRRAIDELQVILEKHLGTHGLLGSYPVEAFGAPRRLVARVRGILLRQADVEKEVTGPPKSVAYDHVGKPTRAAESFAGKQGVSVGKLYLVTTPRGEYVAARRVIRGRPAKEILHEVLPEAILEISWPRSMYWTGIDGPRFIRPIRWIAALLGRHAIRFSLAGLSAGNVSAGHRFLGKSKVTLGSPRDYERRLRSNFVIAQPAERRRKIERELAAAVKGTGLRVCEDPDLLELVTYLNEYPTVIQGDYDSGFLNLPREILVTVMRDHQKYFAVERRDGELAAHFLAVIDVDRDRS